MFSLYFSAGAKVVYTSHYPNGNLKTEVIQLKRGIHKVMRYYESGEIMETGFTKNSLMQGTWVKFDQNGEIIARAYYHNNVKIGSWQHVDPWSKCSYKVQYQNGYAIAYQRYDAGGHLIASGERSP